MIFRKQFLQNNTRVNESEPEKDYHFRIREDLICLFVADIRHLDFREHWMARCLSSSVALV